MPHLITAIIKPFKLEIRGVRGEGWVLQACATSQRTAGLGTAG